MRFEGFRIMISKEVRVLVETSDEASGIHLRARRFSEVRCAKLLFTGTCTLTPDAPKVLTYSLDT